MVDGVEVFCAYTDLVNTDELVGNPRNPNKHPDKQIAMLAKIIKAQGWRAPITISNRSGFVVRGHGRLAAAQKLGLKQVPVDRQDYETEAAEYADLVADNRIAELAGQNNATLKDLLLDFDDGENDMELFGFDDAALEKLMAEVGKKTDAECMLTPEVFEEHNLLILYFDNELDWQAAKETFNLRVGTDELGDRARQKDGSPGRKGLVRVCKGVDILRMANGQGLI